MGCATGANFTPILSITKDTATLAAQKALFDVIRPMARLFGYRTHYEKYAPRA